MFKTDFLNYTKKLKKHIYYAKKQYYCKNLNNSINDLKTTWKTKSLSNILRPNVNLPNVKLKINDDIVCDSLKGSKMFNEYFSSIANTLAHDILSSSSNPIEKNYRLQSTFGFLHHGDLNEVKNVIHIFKSKKSGLNEFPTYAFTVSCSILCLIIF